MQQTNQIITRASHFATELAWIFLDCKGVPNKNDSEHFWINILVLFGHCLQTNARLLSAENKTKAGNRPRNNKS